MWILTGQTKLKKITFFFFHKLWYHLSEVHGACNFQLQILGNKDHLKDQMSPRRWNSTQKKRAGFFG